jgi:alpha-tubulin suppressor-like RCC1 family protein
VVSALTNIVQIAAGQSHACALDGQGLVYCWGSNQLGQLGDGTTEDHHEPEPVTGLAGVIHLSAGTETTCVARADGQALCWGENGFGQLGDGTREPRSTPTPVEGLENVAQLALGAQHSCARTRVGEVYCWGRANWGVLGIGVAISTADWRTSPQHVDTLSNVIELRATGWYSCARLESNGVYCWGGNAYGNLGNGDAVDQSSPVPVIGL